MQNNAELYFEYFKYFSSEKSHTKFQENKLLEVRFSSFIRMVIYFIYENFGDSLKHYFRVELRTC